MNQYYQKDLYAILGVSPDCDEAKIKSAYRKQARRWHPDVNDNSPESIVRFKEITEAYEILCDAQRRSQYDIIKGFNIRREASYSSSASKAQTQSQARRAYKESNTATKQEKTTATHQTQSGYTKNNKTENDNKSSFSQVFENILDGLFT